MARLAVNPTRMELSRLKSRLKTAVRGHKLLKDKSDEMVRQFMTYVRENKRIREELEEKIAKSLSGFMMARAVSTPQSIEQAVSMPSVKVVLNSSTKNVMGVEVPYLTIERKAESIELPYSFASTSSELDSSIENMSELLSKLIELAQVEKTCNMLAFEIEKNRRRVNALEYVVIPQIEETIKYIKMKLEENERGNITRLMKVKEMIAKREG